MFELMLNNINYEYVTSKNIFGKNYIAYKDEDNVYISEYEITDNILKLTSINDSELDVIKEELLND